MKDFSRIQPKWYCLFLIIAILAAGRDGTAASVSPLGARGYTVVPEPQQVTLNGGDFTFSDVWRLELAPGVAPDDVAVQSLKEDLKSRLRVTLSVQSGKRSQSQTVRLAILPNSVAIGQAADRDKNTLAEQAYRIELAARAINITANARPGLFYGVQTFLQLLKPRDGSLWLPEGEIVDWPDLQLREIYWDDAHHLDRLEELKRAVRQAAFFKINGFAIKLEGHFQYASAPAVVEPYALSPAELQELTDYGLRYYVQVVPYLDGPAHVAFILKHPEYAKLRAFPESNYEFCVTNPETYKVLFGMYEDLLEANKGVKYFHLSTDEPYYVGLASNGQCPEVARAQELGSVGKLLAEFVTKTADYLHGRGRTVIFWGEYPLKPEDIPSLPKHLVDGEVYGPDFDPVFRKHGIRQMIYTATQGVEPLFPDYYVLPSPRRLHPRDDGTERVPGIFRQISYTPARKQADLMGVVVAGWGDSGLHPETFWLGYATGAAAGWHPGSPDPRHSMSAFYPLFYGPSATNMGRLYQLMSLQAQFWADSWEEVPSAARKPIFGDSDRIFTPPRPAHDQTLLLPPVPSLPFLTMGEDWSEANASRLRLAAEFLAENDELLDLLQMNLQRVEFNRYNLEVFVSIAQLCRQNLAMLQSLGHINELLKSAQAAAWSQQHPEAVAALDEVLETVEEIRAQRNRVLSETTATWCKSWFPRVAEANGRRFLHDLDDVKDHRADRTADLSYLVYRQLLLPFGEWAEKVQAARHQYAQAHNLPTRSQPLNWGETQVVTPQAQVADE
ncbi:MAG: beta-N-acetylhexosaminidase [Acidobacteriia bacterium]|nr:beta-N-acetylhexosaminidase [Terriglobia bacterium]